MKFSTLAAAAVAFAFSSIVSIAAPTATYLGCELSQGDGRNMGLNWGSTTNTGYKAAWRSTDTPRKAFVFDGEANAYGRDGYLCFWTANSSMGIPGTSFGQALYTGKWAGDNTFTDFAPYVSSLQVLNISAIGNNDGSSQFDDPTLGIGADVADVQSGTYFSRFYDGNAVETNVALRLTFADNVTYYPRIRVGCVVAHGGQPPKSIQVCGAVGEICGVDAYGWFDWYFFELQNVAPGDVVDICLEENREAGSASLDAFVIDAPTLANDSPVITSVISAPVSPTLVDGVATATLSVEATDADGDTLSYLWSCSDGRDAFVDFANPDAATTAVTLRGAGNFVLTARVSDGVTSPVFTNITVRVEPPEGGFYVEYVGCDLSTSQRGNAGAAGWGESTTAGAKSAWRSTNTAPKAFVLPGEPNVYGKDGYICFNTEKGTLAPGSVSGYSYLDVAPYVSSLTLDNFSQFIGNDGNARIDDPTAAIGEDVQAIRSGTLTVRFTDSSERETKRAFSVTFADNVEHYPVIRVGVVNAFQGLTPYAISSGGAVALMTGVSGYGYYNWYFFDVHNAQPGQTLDFFLTENAVQGSASIEMITFDAPTLSNAAPVIDSVSATPSPVPFVEGSGATELAVVATDADGDELVYNWKSIDGRDDAVTLTGTNSATCQATFSGVGDFAFQVSVYDGIAQAVTTNLTVRVEPPAGSFYVEYVGCDHSTALRGNGGAAGWGESTAAGAKSAWRSTNTAPKAFVFDGEPNAYGEDGFICFGTTYTEPPFIDGTLYSGTAYNGAISNIAPFAASFEILNRSQYAGNDPNAQIDNPILGIGEDVASIRSGVCVINFNDASVQETKPVFRVTFSDSVEFYPLVRIGVVVGFYGQTPASISCEGAIALTTPVVNYGTYDWYFFDVHNAQPGQVIDINVQESAVQGSGFIEMVTFDAPTPANEQPVIESISASPARVALSGGSASSVLRASVSDADGNPLTCSWAFDGEQPGIVSLSGDDTTECTATFRAPGTYNLKFTVSDNIGTPVSTTLSVVVDPPAEGEMYVVFVGADLTSTTDMGAVPGGWGSADNGYKRDFRTTSVGNGENGAKDFVLPDHANAYGVDGYVFPGNNWADYPRSSEGGIGQLYTGTGHAPVNGYDTAYSNVASYVEAFEFIASWGGSEGTYNLNTGDMTFIDDPRAAPGPDEIPDINAGDIWINTTGNGYYPLARITFGGNIHRYNPVRVGVLVSRGESRKPSHVALGGTVGKTTAYHNNYYYNDWYFFDVYNASKGASVELDIRNIYNLTTTIQGFVFDAVDIAHPGTILFLR